VKTTAVTAALVREKVAGRGGATLAALAKMLALTARSQASATNRRTHASSKSHLAHFGFTVP